MNKLNKEQKAALFVGIQNLFLFLVLLSCIFFFEVRTLEEVGLPSIIFVLFASFFCLSAVPFLGD